MFDSKSLDQLKPVADEMLGGLKADERMRLAIKRAAEAGVQPRKTPVGRYVPAVCCAALALACVGIAVPRLNTNENTPNAVMLANEPAAVSIETIAAVR